MKIAFVSHSPHMTGAEKMLFNLAKSLHDTKQFDVHVFVYGQGPLVRKCKSEGIRIHVLDNPLPWYLFVKDDIDEIREHWNQVVLSMNELVIKFRAIGIKLVMVNTMTSLTAILAAGELNLPTILWVHGIIDHALIPNLGNKFKLLCDRVILHSATSVICPSDWIKRHYEKLRDGIHIIPNFTNVPSSIMEYPENKTTKFLCLNTWDPRKGMDCLMRAARILKLQNYDFLLNFYGDGLLRESLMRRSVKLGLQTCVRFNSRVEDVSTIFSEAHALITASEIESFGMTVIEAMAHARPVILSRTSGHLEILNNDSFGFFCDVDNEVSFAEKMKWVIEHRNKARQMGVEGYNVALSRYDKNESVLKFAARIKEVVENEQVLSIRELSNRYSLTSLMVDMFSLSIEPLLDLKGIHHDTSVTVGIPQRAIRIRNCIIYKIESPVKTLQSIAVIIGTHHQNPSGTLTLKIFQPNKELLSTCSVCLDNVEDSTWVMFELKEVLDIQDGKLLLEFSVESDLPISIYESKSLLPRWTYINIPRIGLVYKLYSDLLENV